MSPRKIVRGLLAALLAGAAWAGTAGLAYAGGPTSVLIASPTAQRAAGLYYTESRYEELAQAIGGGATSPRARSANPRASTSTTKRWSD